MATTPSIKIVKRFAYRSSTRDWSNRYHFNGGTPANASAWQTLANNITAAEKAIFDSGMKIIEAVGYNAGSDIPVWSASFDVDGTLTILNSHPHPGDAAAMCKWTTTARSVKNHPVYLFSYWHGARSVVDEGDQLWSTQRTAMETYADAWMTGFSDGTHTCVRAGPNGATGVSRIVDEWVRHRDFRV